MKLFNQSVTKVDWISWDGVVVAIHDHKYKHAIVLHRWKITTITDPIILQDDDDDTAETIETRWKPCNHHVWKGARVGTEPRKKDVQH